MKNIVITGVTSGIGYGALQEFIKQGYRVFGSVRNKEDADRLAKEFGSTFIPLLCDITDHKTVYEAAATVKNILKNEGLDGLINNAGAAEGGPLMHMPIDVFQKHLDVLVTGHLATCQAFLPLLGAQDQYPFKPGRIINISSIAGKSGSPFIGAYVAAKHALEGLSKTLQIELQPYGIDVVIISPGLVQTKIWDKIQDETFEKYKGTIYYQPFKNFVNFFKKAMPYEGIELQDFSVRIRKIFETDKPKLHYLMVRNKFKNWTVPETLPRRTVNKMTAKMFGLKVK